MDANRIAAALERIAVAVERIEQARPPEGEGSLGLRLAQMTARHDNLRAVTRSTLSSLDDLIAAQNRDKNHG